MPEGERAPEGGEARARGVLFLFLFFLFFILCAFATRREEEEEEECVLRAGMMRPNRGFILLLLNGTACLVREEFFWGGWRVTARTLCTFIMSRVQHFF